MGVLILIVALAVQSGQGQLQPFPEESSVDDAFASLALSSSLPPQTSRVRFVQVPFERALRELQQVKSSPPPSTDLLGEGGSNIVSRRALLLPQHALRRRTARQQSSYQYPSGLCHYYALQGIHPKFCQGSQTLRFSPAGDFTLLQEGRNAADKFCSYYIIRGYLPPACKKLFSLPSSVDEPIIDANNEVEEPMQSDQPLIEVNDLDDQGRDGNSSRKDGDKHMGSSDGEKGSDAGSGSGSSLNAILPAVAAGIILGGGAGLYNQPGGQYNRPIYPQRPQGPGSNYQQFNPYFPNNQYSGVNSNAYNPQISNQYPSQYPNSYPNQNPYQNPYQYPNQYPSQYPSKFPPPIGGSTTFQPLGVQPINGPFANNPYQNSFSSSKPSYLGSSNGYSPYSNSAGFSGQSSYSQLSNGPYIRSDSTDTDPSAEESTESRDKDGTIKDVIAPALAGAIVGAIATQALQPRPYQQQFNNRPYPFNGPQSGFSQYGPYSSGFASNGYGYNGYNSFDSPYQNGGQYQSSGYYNPSRPNYFNSYGRQGQNDSVPTQVAETTPALVIAEETGEVNNTSSANVTSAGHDNEANITDPGLPARPITDFLYSLPNSVASIPDWQTQEIPSAQPYPANQFLFADPVPIYDRPIFSQPFPQLLPASYWPYQYYPYADQFLPPSVRTSEDVSTESFLGGDPITDNDVTVVNEVAEVITEVRHENNETFIEAEKDDENATAVDRQTRHAVEEKIEVTDSDVPLVNSEQNEIIKPQGETLDASDEKPDDGDRLLSRQFGSTIARHGGYGHGYGGGYGYGHGYGYGGYGHGYGYGGGALAAGALGFVAGDLLAQQYRPYAGGYSPYIARSAGADYRYSFPSDQSYVTAFDQKTRGAIEEKIDVPDSNIPLANAEQYDLSQQFGSTLARHGGYGQGYGGGYGYGHGYGGGFGHGYGYGGYGHGYGYGGDALAAGALGFVAGDLLAQQYNPYAGYPLVARGYSPYIARSAGAD